MKAIDVNQKVAGQSQERGATPLIYCCVEADLQGAQPADCWLQRLLAGLGLRMLDPALSHATDVCETASAKYQYLCLSLGCAFRARRRLHRPQVLEGPYQHQREASPPFCTWCRVQASTQLHLQHAHGSSFYSQTASRQHTSAASAPAPPMHTHSSDPSAISAQVGQTKEREPKNEEALDPAARERLYNETEKILAQYM